MYCVEWMMFFIFTTYFSSSEFLQINLLFYVTGGIPFFLWALFGFPSKKILISEVCKRTIAFFFFFFFLGRDVEHVLLVLSSKKRSLFKSTLPKGKKEAEETVGFSLGQPLVLLVPLLKGAEGQPRTSWGSDKQCESQWLFKDTKLFFYC